MLLRIRGKAAALALIVFIAGTCSQLSGRGIPEIASQAFAAEQAMMLPVDPAPLIIDTLRGKAKFEIEIAASQDQRSRGLMFRRIMPGDRGMLFVFETTRPLGFWMKNTVLPLDLLFIGEDGKIRDIRRGEPYSEAPISPDGPGRFVLELNAGTSEKMGIEIGDQLHHPVIDSVRGTADTASPG